MSARVYAAGVVFVLTAPRSYGGKILMMYVAKLNIFISINNSVQTWPSLHWMPS